MNIRKNEVFRYLGYHGHPHDAETEALAEEISEAVSRTVTPKSVYREFSLEISAEKIVIGGSSGIVTESKGLQKNLEGCNSVILFAATLGAEADAIVRRYSLTSSARAAIAQAVCAEATESYADEINEKIKAQAAENGRFLRPRFSPGYGDFPLSYQTDLFRLLDISKHIGVTLNDSLLMVPTKSITAVIGISDRETQCGTDKCLTCGKKDCEFRNEF